MSQQYELLAIFPGTLAETEIGGAAEKVKSLLEKHGATDVVLHDLGKSRLAYPMKHIRYGYFRLYYFGADPATTPVLHGKVVLSNETLRAILRVRDPEKQPKIPEQIVSDAAIATEIDERRESGDSVTAPVRERVEEKVPETPVERKTEAVQLEDIDKKLDELLEGDLTKV